MRYQIEQWFCVFEGTEWLEADFITTPLGEMLALADDSQLHMLEFCDLAALENRLKTVQRFTKARIRFGDCRIFEQIRQDLAAYFAGERAEFSVKGALHGSDFSQKVWRFLQKIPAGSTRSYKQQAEAIGRPTAYRAVARANSQNKMAIIVPCHRVIGANGALTGYAGGVARKQWLLAHEEKYFSRLSVIL